MLSCTKGLDNWDATIECGEGELVSHCCILLCWEVFFGSLTSPNQRSIERSADKRTDGAVHAQWTSSCYENCVIGLDSTVVMVTVVAAGQSRVTGQWPKFITAQLTF